MLPDYKSDSLANDLSRLRLKVAIERLLCGTLVCFVVVRVLVPGDFSGVGSNLFILTLFVFALVLTSVLAAIDGGIFVFRDWHLCTVILFGLAIIVSPFVADSKFDALNHMVGWLPSVALFLLLVSFQGGGRGARELVRFTLCALFATTFSVGAIATLQWWFGFAEMRKEIATNPAALDFLPPPLLHEFHVRLLTNEPFACFGNPNSLAGFLVLVVPALLALSGVGAFPRTQSSGRRVLIVAGRALLCVLVVGLVFVIALTGSRGGVGGFLVAMFVLLVGIRTRARRKLLAILTTAGLCVAVAVVTLGFLTEFDPLELKNPASSMGVRLGYWRATLKMILERPLLGVGLDNFAGHYLRLKGALAGETIRAHNDYLNICAELGIPAALLFIVFWGVLVWRALRRDDEDSTVPGSGAGISDAGNRGVAAREARTTDTVKSDSEKEQPAADFASHGRRFLLLYCLGGGAVAWLLAWTFHPSLMFARGIPQIVVWFFTFAICEAMTARFAEREERLLHAGMVAGLCGLLAHSCMEFNFYVHGIALAAWLLAAIVYARAARMNSTFWTLSGRARAVFVALLLGVFVFLTWEVVPNRLKAEENVEWASEKMRDVGDQASEVIVKLEEAAELSPGDPHIWHRLAIARHLYGCSRIDARIVKEVLKDNGEEGVRRLFGAAHDPCVFYARRAIEADPTASKLHFLLGVYEGEHAAALRLYGQYLSADGRATLEKTAVQREQAALEALASACRWYPTCAENRYQYGLALEKAGRTPEAVREYREALRLHALQKLPRLRLDEKVVEELKKKTGAR